MRLRNLRKLEEMEIRGEDKDLRNEVKGIKAVLASEEEQWKKVGEQVRKVRDTFGPKTPLGKRRTQFADAPEHDLAAIEEALIEREPITVVVSDKGWVRTLKGHVEDLSNLAFKTDDSMGFSFFAESTSTHAVRQQRPFLYARCAETAGRAWPWRSDPHDHRYGRRCRYRLDVRSERRAQVPRREQ
jgi:DNA gyrase/topoisomerase IV subunit A